MKSQIVLAIIVVLFLLVSSSLYIVDQRQKAIVFQLGEVVSVKTSPGLYFKIPMVQNVRFFCRIRLLQSKAYSILPPLTLSPYDILYHS